MMRARSLKTAACVLLAAVWLAAGTGFAAAQTTSDVLADTVIQVQLWPEAEPNSTIMIVGAVLPTDTPLPTVVEFPVPNDAEVVWAGEVTGSSVENDIQRTPEIVDVDGGKVVRFEVQTYRAVQYEAYLTPPTIDGNTVSQTLQWLQTVSAQAVSVAWRLPANTTDIQLDPDAPAEPSVNEAGEKLYTLASVVLAPGASQTYSASYAYFGTAETSGTSGNSVLWIVGGLLLVAVVALVVVLIRQMPPAVRQEDDE